jgi:hypothetical protein
VSILTENAHGQIHATGNDLVALARDAFNLLVRQSRLGMHRRVGT